MGREIELKVPLSDKEYQRLYNLFFNKSEEIFGLTILKAMPSIIIKKDEYWSRYDSREERKANNEPQVIRIRSEEFDGQSKAFFTIKHKVYQNGIELNKEDETFVEDPEVLREFFVEAGYHKWFEKVKKSYGVFCNSSVLPGVEFHVEVEEVNGLPYVEIEVTQDDGDADIIKQGLNDLVKQLGLNPGKRDIRSWVEIIQEKKD